MNKLITPDSQRRALGQDDEFARHLYERDLMDFTAAGWKYVEPQKFMTNWHIQCVCEHLEWVADGEITRLLINIPPRHMKSRGANVFFPAWVWAQDPDPFVPSLGRREGHGHQVQTGKWRGPGVKFMHLAYDARLSMRDSVYCRQLLRSPWYQNYWGERVQPSPDQDTKGRFDNLRGGYRISTSENGLVTGEGGDIIIFDDPHNAREVDSEIVRNNTLKFWDESMPSRLNDQKRGVFIVIMQRLHENDLTGHIIAHELGWVHLCLPAMYEPFHPYVFNKGLPHRHDSEPGARYTWQKGETWKDPRAPADVLWEEAFPAEALHRIAKDDQMSSHVAAGQLQQRPSARDGGLFKKNWFEIVEPDKVPHTALYNRVRAWDLASSAEAKNDPDFTVGLLMGRDPLTNTFYIFNVFRDRMTPGGVEAAVVRTAKTDGHAVKVRLPQDPGQAGKFQVRHFVNRLNGFTVKIEPEENTKEQRADSFSAQCEVGNVKLVKGDWNKTFIEEMCAFPKASHDDQVDAVTAAYRTLIMNPNIPLQTSYGAR